MADNTAVVEEDPISHSLAASTAKAKRAAMEAEGRHSEDPRNVHPVVPEQKSGLPVGYPVFAIRGMFLIAVVAALFFAKNFFLPIVVAFILALTISPAVRWLSRRHIPAPVSAIFIVMSMIVTTLIGAYVLSVPVADWVDRAPEIGRQLEEKLNPLREPMEALRQAENQVSEATEDANVQSVVVKGPSIVTSAAASFMSGFTSLTITAVLLAFLLASGDLFYAKLVRIYDTLADKKRALRIAHDVERVVSRYLFTITLINIGLGIVVGTGLWLLGMPTPYIFGILAAVANFIPYIGAILGIAAATAVAVVTFPELSMTFTVTAFYFAATFMEGQIITPLIVGRRLELNAVAVFISLAFWAWLWGIVGALIAVPMLVIAKTICDHFEGLDTLGEFLSGQPFQPDKD